MDNFSTIIGNDPIKKQLSLLLERENVPHLLLFSGIDGIGKRLFAKEFASLWLKKAKSSFQPDVHLFSPEGKIGMHSIRGIRRLLEELSLAPYGNAGKAVLINDAERMLPTSANALLKTLEEPPKNTLIILISSQPERLLSTIVSRCQQIRFCPISDTKIATYLHIYKNLAENQATQIALRSSGSVAKACRLLSNQTNELEELLFSFLTLLQKPFNEISKIAKALQQELEGRKKAYESALKDEYGASLKEFTSSQKELVEQEIEGALSVAYFRDVFELLTLIQSFYRDLVAIGCQAPLLLSHKKEALETSYNLGQSVPLDRLERLLEQARVSLERSTPIQFVLESLFLQIG